MQFQFFFQNRISYWRRKGDEELDTNKAPHSSDISTIILKQSVDFFFPLYQAIIIN